MSANQDARRKWKRSGTAKIAGERLGGDEISRMSWLSGEYMLAGRNQ